MPPSSFYPRPLSTAGLVVVGSTYSPCPRWSGAFLCSKADQNQTHIDFVSESSHQCPHLSGFATPVTSLDTRGLPSPFSMPMPVPKPKPMSVRPTTHPIPRPFLATSCVRRIYPRCGQRHVTWIESVIVSCAPSLGCRIQAPRWVLQLLLLLLRLPHPLGWPVSTGCTGLYPKDNGGV